MTLATFLILAGVFSLPFFTILLLILEDDYESEKSKTPEKVSKHDKHNH